MPIFTIIFCAIIVLIYILDNMILIPQRETVTLKERLLTGHNKGYLNSALRLSEKKIKNGQIWRLVSSSLLHIGAYHIAANTVAMLIVGYAVESQLGAMKTAVCFAFSVLVSGLYMSFIFKLQEGEGASTGIYGLIAVFVVLSVKNRTVMFSDLPIIPLVVLGIYTVGGMIANKATIFEHLSGFAGGLFIGLILT